MTETVGIRTEAPEDAADIRRLTGEAFAGAEHSSGTESAIIDSLRAAGALSLSLVASVDGRIVGHVAFSPVAVAGRDPGWFGLGPVAVQPDRQRAGIGSRLVRDGLARMRAAGAKGCVVLGDPGYYRRFGFLPAAAMTFAGAPPACFMALTFAGPAPAGPVSYQPAFYLS